jgi:tetratricopeptide (TPR) repeat protein
MNLNEPRHAWQNYGWDGRNSVYRVSFYVLVSLVFIGAPFLVGLWPIELRFQFFGVFFCLFLIIALLMTTKTKTYSFLPLSYVLCAFVIAYIFSIFYAADKNGALEALLNWLAYLFFYIFVCEYARRDEYKYKVIIIALLGGLIVAAFSIIVRFGLIAFPAGMFGIRLAGPFGYSNTLAGYMMFCLLMSFAMAIRWVRSRPFFGLAIIIFSTVMLATGSRGAILIFLSVLFLLLVLLLRKKDYDALETVVKLILFCIPLSIGASSCLESGNIKLFFLIILLASICLVASNLYSIIRTLSYFNIMLLLFAITISFYAVQLTNQQHVQLLEMLESANEPAYNVFLIADRIQNLSDLSASSKFIYYKDAIKIISDHPFGLGGGGWELKYREYQTYGYQNNMVHNHFLQTAIEIGWIGIVLWLVLIGWITKCLFDKKQDTVNLIIMSGPLGLIAYGMIDGVLSFPFLSMVLWGILGWYAVNEGDLSHKEDKTHVTASTFLAIGVMIGLVLVTSRLYINNLETLAKDAVQQEEYAQAAHYYKKATYFDHYNSDLYFKQAKILTDQGLADEARESAQKALDLVPYSHYYWQLAQILLLYDEPKLEEAFINMGEAVKLNPFNIKYNLHYEELANELINGYIAEGAGREKAIIQDLDEYKERIKLLQANVPAWVPDEMALRTKYLIDCGDTEATTSATDRIFVVFRNGITANDIARTVRYAGGEKVYLINSAKGIYQIKLKFGLSHNHSLNYLCYDRKVVRAWK